LQYWAGFCALKVIMVVWTVFVTVEVSVADTQVVGLMASEVERSLP